MGREVEVCRIHTRNGYERFFLRIAVLVATAIPEAAFTIHSSLSTKLRRSSRYGCIKSTRAKQIIFQNQMKKL